MERFRHGGDTYGLSGVVDFSASLNPLGMPAVAREALLGCIDACESYPDPACRELTRAIAHFEGLDERMVLACAGATDAFSRLCLSLGPVRAVTLEPCYSGYEQALTLVGSTVTRVMLREEEGFSADTVLSGCVDEGVGLVFVASPNNPTGRCVSLGVAEGLLDRAQEIGARVVLDECFIDLVEGGKSAVGMLEDHPNLVIVKALTKTFALAGLRVGYALCSNESLLARMRLMGQPWAVSVPAQAAGVACLRDESDYLARSCSLIVRERSRLVRALTDFGMEVIPSDANYLLWKASEDLMQRLLEKGVLVRSCANFEGLGDRWHRTAVRTAEDNDVLIKALGEVVS